MNEIISYLPVGTGWFRRSTAVLYRSLHCWFNTSKLCSIFFLLFHTLASLHHPSHRQSLQVIFPACKAQVSLQVHLPANSPTMGRIAAEVIHPVLEETASSTSPQRTLPNNVQISTNGLLKEPHQETRCQRSAALRQGLGGTARGEAPAAVQRLLGIQAPRH